MQCEKLISGGNKIAAAQRSHSKNWHLNRPSSSRAAQFKQAKHVSSQVHFQTGVYRPQLYWGCKECFKDEFINFVIQQLVPLKYITWFVTLKHEEYKLLFEMITFSNLLMIVPINQ